jgi:hypothetical protein
MTTGLRLFVRDVRGGFAGHDDCTVVDHAGPPGAVGFGLLFLGAYVYLYAECQGDDEVRQNASCDLRS